MNGSARTLVCGLAILVGTAVMLTLDGEVGGALLLLFGASLGYSIARWERTGCRER